MSSEKNYTDKKVETIDGSLGFKVTLDNTQLKAGTEQTKTALKDIGDTAKAEGARIENSFDQAAQNGFKSFDGMTTNLKQQIALQQQLIREISADIKNYQDQLANTSNPKAKASLEGEIAGGKSALVEANGQLIAMQRQQVEGNLKETESQGGLLSGLGKWALGLATVAGAMELAKKIIDSTATGVEAFETVMNQASAATHYFFQSIATGNFNNFSEGIGIAIDGAKKYTEAMIRVQNMHNQDLVTAPIVGKQIADAYIEITNKVGKSSTQQLADIDAYLGLIKTKYKPLIETAKADYDALMDYVVSKTGGLANASHIDDFLSKFRDLEGMMTKGQQYNDLQRTLTAYENIARNPSSATPTSGGHAFFQVSPVPTQTIKGIQDQIKALGSDAKDAGKYVSEMMLIDPAQRQDLAKLKSNWGSLDETMTGEGRRMMMRRGTIAQEEATKAQEHAKQLLNFDNEYGVKRVELAASIMQQIVDTEADGQQKQRDQAQQHYEKTLADINKQQAEELKAYNSATYGKNTSKYLTSIPQSAPDDSSQRLQNLVSDGQMYDQKRVLAVQDRDTKMQKIDSDSSAAIKKIMGEITEYALSQSEKEILAINQKYDGYKKLATENGATQKQLDDIETARAGAISQAHMDVAIKVSAYYKKVFGDISTYGYGTIKNLADQTKSVLDSAVQKDVGGKTMYIVSIPDIDAQGNAIKRNVTLTIEEFNALQKKYNELNKDLQKQNPFKALTDSFDDIGKALESGDSDKISNAVKQFNISLADSMTLVKSWGDSLSIIFPGAAADIKAVTSLLGGASDITSGVLDFSSGDIVGGITNSLKGAAQIYTTLTAGAKAFHDAQIAYTEDQIKEQLAYNLVLIDQGAAQAAANPNIFIIDYIQQINTAYDALQMAQEDLNKILNPTYDTSKWGAFGTVVEQWLAGLGQLNTVINDQGVTVHNTLSQFLSSLQIQTGVAKDSFLGITTGSHAVYGDLLTKYPELIDSTGQFNEALAKTIVGMKGVPQATQDALNSLIAYTDAVAANKKTIDDAVSSMASFISSDLSSALTTAWDNGTDAFLAFKDSVSTGLKQIIEQMVYNSVFSGAFKQLQSDLTATFTGTSTETLIQDFTTFFNQGKTLTQQYNDAMTASTQAATAAGFDFTSAASRTAATGSLTSMNQDSANEMNGRLTAMQGHTFEINEGVKILTHNSGAILQHLAGIESNTGRLEAIENGIIAMQGGIDTINLKGILLKK